MRLTTSLPASTRWGIMLIGFLTGVLFAVLTSQHFAAVWSVYLLLLAMGFSSVLAFVTTRFRAPAPWLLSLSVLPFLALMIGWMRWNHPQQPVNLFIWDVIPVMLCWLYLLTPFLQARVDNAQANRVAAVITALWRNSFTLAATALLTALFWLILFFWSQLFGLIEIRLFERLFFDNDYFPPIATGAAIAAGIALCRSLPAAGEVFQRFVTVLASAIMPLHALVSLLFLAFLPFTGLAIIPQSVSAASLLSIMSLAMMVMAAMVGSSQRVGLRYPGWLQKLVTLAQWLMPLFAIMACYALWLRVSQYGWTVDRINAAAVVAVTLVWTLANAWWQRRAWQQPLQHLDVVSAGALGLMALLWLLLHSPVIDPFRITVNNQLARLEQHRQRADINDIYMLSHAGRRGHQALLVLQAHPEWLSRPELRATLAQVLTGDRSNTPAAIDPAMLREKIRVRQGSPLPPESWWRQPDGDNPRAIQTCLYSASPCTVWMMDLNADGKAEVLLFDPTQRQVAVFTDKKDRWRQVGQSSSPQQSTAFDQAIEQGSIQPVEKPWRDLQIDGRRYPVHYYGME